MPEDILTLGFGFESDSTVGAIARLAENFDSLEKTTGSVKTALETLFGGTVTAGIAAASTHLMNIGDSMRTASESALALQTSMTRLPKSFERLSAIKFSPLTQKQVDNIYRFTSSLANMTRQSDFSQYSMGNLSKIMQTMSGFSVDLAKNLNRLPGKLERIAQIKMNPISERVIKSLRDYASALKQAAEAMGALVSGQGKLSDAPLRKLNKTLEDGGEKAKGFWDALVDTGKMAALTKMFKNAIRDSTRFGTELAHIGSLTMDFDMGKVRTGLMDLSSEYGDVTKNAEAMYYAYSSGVRGNEQDLVNFTGKMGQLGTLIRANTTTTVDAVTGLMNAYNISIAESPRVADLFYNIVKEGKASGAQLASSLGQVTPTAATAGVKLNELGAALAVLTKVMPTRNAITYLNNALSKLIKPTKESRLEAEKFGIELGLEAVRAKGFANIMAEIREKTQGSQQAITKIFPDLRGMRGALQLLGAGWEDFQNQLDIFANGAGAADAAMDKLTANAAYQFSVIPNTLKKISIEIGNVVSQILTLGGTLTPLLIAFNKMDSSAVKTVAWVTAISGGMAALIKISSLMKAKWIKLVAVSVAENATKKLTISQLWQEARARLAVSSAAKAELASKAGLAGANAAGAAAGAAGSLKTVLSLSFSKVVATVVTAAAKLTSIISGIASVLGVILIPVLALTAAFAGLDMILAKLYKGDASAGYVGKLMDWFAGVGKAQKASEELSKRLDKQNAAKAFRVNVADKLVDLVRDGLSSAFIENVDLPKKSITEQVMEYEKKFIGDIGKAKEIFGSEKLKAMYDELRELEKIAIQSDSKEAWSNVEKKRQEMQKLSESAAAFSQTLLNGYNKAIEPLRRAISIITDVQNEFSKIRYGFMSDKEKFKFNLANLLDASQKFMDGVYQANADVVKKSYDNMIKAHNALVKFAESKIKKFDDLGKSARKDMFDSVLQYTHNYMDRMKIYNNEADRLGKEAGLSKDSLGFFVAEDAKFADPTASYNKAKEAFAMQIKALQEEISYKKELAQAEAQANQRTLELIRSMDKYQSAAAQAVNAWSADAARLQSRRFTAMPDAKPLMSTSSQSGLSRSQEKLDQLYRNMAEASLRFAEIAKQEKERAETQKGLLESNLKGVMDRTETYLQEIKEKQEKKADELRDIVANIIPEVQSIGKSVNNISIVTY